MSNYKSTDLTPNVERIDETRLELLNLNHVNTKLRINIYFLMTFLVSNVESIAISIRSVNWFAISTSAHF